MKEINGQLYGYSYELDATSEDDGTTCFAVDTGTVFVAYKGVWYEQPGSRWATSIAASDDDILGLSYEVNKTIPADDLTVFNAVDTGERFISFSGAWYAQPVQWSAPAAGGGGGSGLPEVSASDNGDVLTVVDGEWDKAAPSGGGALVVNITYDDGTSVYTCDKTAGEMMTAFANGVVIGAQVWDDGLSYGVFSEANYDEEQGYSFSGLQRVFIANASTDYPATSSNPK